VRAIRAAVPGLERLSAERVWSEIKRLMAAPDPRAALGLMAETGVLGAVLPEAGNASRLDLAMARGEHDVLLRIAILLPVGTDLSALGSRLRLSGDEGSRLVALHAVQGAPDPSILEAPPFGARIREWRARVRAQSDAAAPGEVILVAAAEAGNGERHRELADVVDPALGPPFPLEGRDVLALGVPPGPRIGALLREVREWWFRNGAPDDAAACLEQLRQLAQRESS